MRWTDQVKSATRNPVLDSPQRGENRKESNIYLQYKDSRLNVTTALLTAK